MNLLRLGPLRKKGSARAAPAQALGVVRRFFRLIERLEAPRRRIERQPAPETKARITRLDTPYRH